MIWILPIIFVLAAGFIFWWAKFVNKAGTDGNSSDLIQKAESILSNSVFRRKRMFQGMVYPPANQTDRTRVVTPPVQPPEQPPVPPAAQPPEPPAPPEPGDDAPKDDTSEDHNPKPEG